MSLGCCFAGCFWAQSPRIEPPQSCQESCMEPNPGQRVEVIDKDWRGTKKHLQTTYIVYVYIYMFIYIHKTPGFGPKPWVCIRKYGFPTETLIFNGSWLWRYIWYIVFYIRIKMNQDETLWIQMNSPQSLWHLSGYLHQLPRSGHVDHKNVSTPSLVWTVCTLQNRKKNGMNPALLGVYLRTVSYNLHHTISKLSTATM